LRSARAPSPRQAPKAAKTAAAAADGEAAPPKPKKMPKMKPFTAEDVETAKGASMERNEAAALFIDGVAAAYKEAGEYVKAANTRKASASLRAYAAPFKVPQELLALAFIGQGTVDKIAAWLKEGGGGGGGGAAAAGGALAAAADAAAAAAGKKAELAWLADSEADVIQSMLDGGQIALADVLPWRPDFAPK